MAHLYSTHSYEPSDIYCLPPVCKIVSMTAITDTMRSLVNDSMQHHHSFSSELTQHEDKHSCTKLFTVISFRYSAEIAIKAYSLILFYVGAI